MQKAKLLLVIFSLLCCVGPIAGYAQTGGGIQVSGLVTSAEDHQPLIGVNVIAGPTLGVSTLADGTYSITVAAGTRLIFQYIGYKSVEFTVPAGSAKLVYDVVLESDSQKLDDVVVIAYGVRKKNTVAGSVSSIKTEKLESTPTAAFDQALQGQVPGLSVMAVSGEPSVSTVMKIRGTNSINSGTEPLYILDGVAISSADFNTVNPADIESLSVLKDASSTSIYGARAANGVIVITTKRGRRADKPVISYRMQVGFSQISQANWNIMNTDERIRYEQEIGMTTGKNYDLLRRTDVNWLDAVFNDKALLQDYELSVSGATDKTNYYFSGGYYNQEGTAVGSGFKRYSLRANVEQRAARWLKIGTNTSLNYQEIERADEGQPSIVAPISAAQFMMPYWNPFRADGSLASIEDGSWKGDGQNPLEWLANNPLTYKKYKLFSTIYAEAMPIEGLTLKSQFSVDYSHTTSFSVSYPEYSPNLQDGAASRSSTDGLQLAVTNTVNYAFSLDDKHTFNFLLGHEGIDYHYEDFSLSARGQSSNKLTDISNATRVTRWSDTRDNDYGYLSFFGRAEYSYANRYFVELAARTDASSRFGKANRWGRFWSAGFMWNLRNERFMERAARWLTDARVSLSTGTSGNSSIPNYEHLALVSGGYDYIGNAGVAPSQQGSEHLRWEKPWTTNVGLHFGFWNRLQVDLEFYNKKTADMLMEVPQSYSDNGYGFRWDNVGTMVNRGVELTLLGTLITAKDFLWTVNATVSYNKNKITALYNGVREYEMANTSRKLVVGHDVGEYYINRFAGVNPVNGDALWYTRDGELTTELRDEDKVMIGKSQFAPWEGGFGTSLEWKGLSLSAQFSWVADRWMINNDRYFNESNGRFASYNQSRRLLDRWKQPGDVTDIPRHGVFTEFDSRLLEDASFLRLKNLMLSYSFPKELLRKTRVFSGIRIYAQAQNLFTVTPFSGLDPESPYNIYIAQYPTARQFTFGLDLTF
ncbi:MAG: TonB-dependent receptor [Alistipes sp.]|nr:TonB-dependent receptor [Alistipes sp.]